MKIVKRNGKTEKFNASKIVNAIRKANQAVPEVERIDRKTAEAIAAQIAELGKEYPLTVEEIQDEVILGIQKAGCFRLATAYTEYRYKHEIVRRSQAANDRIAAELDDHFGEKEQKDAIGVELSVLQNGGVPRNTTDDNILEIVEGENETANEENSNKNATILSTQRDYMAGEVSKDVTRRFLLPPDISAAHDAGIIHFHDADYFAQHMHNCDLVNMEDMLQNGTVISGTKIEKPHSFSTACNVATQIVAQVASSQYGGQSFSLAHLSPFVEVSRQAFRKEVAEEMEENGIDATEEQINAAAERRVLKEVNKGIQTIQYQLVTLMTTNG